MMKGFWTAPNQLTLLRLVFIPFIVINVLEAEFGWALGLFIAAGITDALDGLLARLLHQKTTIGQYLDPIADKLLLSSLFLVLSFRQVVPWKFTVLVFSRDLSILAVSMVLYALTSLRDFQPSVFGKLNTVAQVGAIFLVLLNEVVEQPWVLLAKHWALWLVLAFTLLSGLHYIYLTGQRLHHNSTAH